MLEYISGNSQVNGLSGEELGLLKRQAKREKRRKERRPDRAERKGNGEDKPRLVETKPNVAKVKIFPLGFDLAGAVTPDTYRVVETSQWLFHPTRGIVSVASTTALDNWMVDDLKVGNRSQTTVDASFPSRMFSDAADDAGLDLDLVPGGIELILEGTYFGAALAADARIVAGFYGDYFESIAIKMA
jgi:hypothetical protein